MSSNLPPGVTDDMIPGDRPDDIAYNKWWDGLTCKQVKEYAKKFILTEQPGELLGEFLMKDCTAIKESYRITCLLFMEFHLFMEREHSKKEL